MRKYLLQIVGLAVLCTTIYSCKLDAPILPGDPNYVAVTPPGGGDGGTGGTTPIDNVQLTGRWVATQPFSSVIYSDGVLANTSSEPSNPTFFTAIDMDDATKITTFEGQFTLPQDETSYVLSTANSKNYLQFSADVFQRTSNAPVQIVSFTGTTMTWIALDPYTVTSEGHKVQSGWEVKLTKQ